MFLNSHGRMFQSTNLWLQYYEKNQTRIYMQQIDLLTVGLKSTTRNFCFQNRSSTTLHAYMYYNLTSNCIGGFHKLGELP